MKKETGGGASFWAFGAHISLAALREGLGGGRTILWSSCHFSESQIKGSLLHLCPALVAWTNVIQPTVSLAHFQNPSHAVDQEECAQKFHELPTFDAASFHMVQLLQIREGPIASVQNRLQSWVCYASLRRRTSKDRLHSVTRVLLAGVGGITSAPRLILAVEGFGDSAEAFLPLGQVRCG